MNNGKTICRVGWMGALLLALAGCASSNNKGQNSSDSGMVGNPDPAPPASMPEEPVAPSPTNEDLQVIPFRTSEFSEEQERIDQRPPWHSDATEPLIEELYKAPEIEVSFFEAELADVFRVLAEAARLSYIAPTTTTIGEQVVTLRVTENPFRLMETLAESYGVGLDYTEGVWRFYRDSPNFRYMAKYRLRFEDLQQWAISSPSLANTLGQSGGSGESGGSGGGGASTGDSGGSVTVEQTLVDRLAAALPLDGGRIRAAIDDGLGGEATRPGYTAPGNAAARAPEPQIVYFEEQGELVVTATRAQHEYIRELLRVIDRPAPQIRISAHFVQTTRDPRTILGIDWNGLLNNRSLTLESVIDEGAGGTLQSPVIDLSAGAPDNVWPTATIFSTEALSVALNAIANDAESKLVQDPTVVTVANRPVNLRVTRQIPVIDSTTENSDGGGTDTTTDITYIDVGTLITVRPQVVEDHRNPGHHRIRLGVSIVVSSQEGERIIDGNPFPVVDARQYEYEVVVPNRSTMAVGGLKESRETLSATKVPLLGDIPLLGRAFRSEERSTEDLELIAYISAEIVDDGYHFTGDESRLSRLRGPQEFVRQLEMQ